MYVALMREGEPAAIYIEAVLEFLKLDWKTFDNIVAGWKFGSDYFKLTLVKLIENTRQRIDLWFYW